MEERVSYLESTGMAIELTKQESRDFELVLNASAAEELLAAFEIAQPAIKKLYCEKTYMRSSRLLWLSEILVKKHGQEATNEVMRRIDEMCEAVAD